MGSKRASAQNQSTESSGNQQPKRSRVVRACDRCRKLKIKCSGDMPCIHCTVYSYECTYDEPSKSKRKQLSIIMSNSVNQSTNNANSNNNNNNTNNNTVVNNNSNANSSKLINELTTKVKIYDEIIRKLLPQMDEASIQPAKLQNALASMAQDTSIGNTPIAFNPELITNVYHSMPDSPLPNNLQDALPALDSPMSGTGAGLNESDNVGLKIKIILPPLNIALDLISKTWENACVLFRFYHRPAFIQDLNELYATDPSQYTNKQQRFLPLVYSVLACGALFSKKDETPNYKIESYAPVANNEGLGREGTLVDADVSTPPGKSNSTPIGSNASAAVSNDEGYQYFIAARRLIDITDTRDTYGIQTIVMLIIFLQCSARLSTCYAYIGIALRAALREGLHRKLNYPFNPVELEIRKRLFWTIYKMDIYVNTMLGLPRTIARDDFDQDMPVELDDENITLEGYRFDKQNRVSSSAIANYHTKLIEILRDVVAKLYPVRAKDNMGLGSESTYIDVLHLEDQLQNWLQSLPMELKPGIEPSAEYLRANRVLHIAYLHVRIVLYRPFIHYIAKRRDANTTADEKIMIEKATNCINVARVVVKLAEDMISTGILSGAYWFSVYTIFFSIACLVYYVHFAPETQMGTKGVNVMTPEYQEYLAIKKDAERGKRVLDMLKDSSMAARRTYNILNALFEQLNRKTATNNNNSSASNTASETSRAQVPTKQFPIIPAPSNFTNEASTDNKTSNNEIEALSNGINFIDGVATGVDINGQNSNFPFVDPGVQPAGQPTQSAATPTTTTTVSNNSNFATTTTDGDVKYAPGFMDQLDMKLFGRFLPPYMLEKDKDKTKMPASDAPPPVVPPVVTPRSNRINTPGGTEMSLPFIDFNVESSADPFFASEQIQQMPTQQHRGSIPDVPAGLSTVFGLDGGLEEFFNI